MRRAMQGRLRTIDWIRRAVRLLGEGIAPGLWLFSGLLVAGVTLLRIGTVPVDVDGVVVARIAGGVQLLAILLLTFFLYRAAAKARVRARLVAPLLRFALLFLGLFLLTLAVLAIVARLLPTEARIADVWLAALAATLAINVVLLPLAPWQTALAMGDRTLGIGGGWRGLRAGGLGGLVGAYLATVGPALAIHLALTLLIDDPAAAHGGTALVALVAVDSAASLAQLVLTVGLGVAAWTVARERAGKLDGPPPSTT